MITPLAQDPDELFDVVTAEGKPTGVTKRRADVHHDGDWHQAIHVWVYGSDDKGPYLLLNRRGRHKDTWPLALDATVGGHFRAGETVEDAYREVEEEIGITVEPNLLQSVGRRTHEFHGDIPGIVDREIQDIYIYRDDRPLMGFVPNPAELEGLVCIALQDATALFLGRIPSAPALMLRADARTIEEMTIQYDDLLTLPGDDYFTQIARVIADAIAAVPNPRLSSASHE